MCKKLIFLTSFVLVLGLVGSASARMVAHWKFDRMCTECFENDFNDCALDWSGNDFHARVLRTDYWYIDVNDDLERDPCDPNIPINYNDAHISIDPERGGVLDLDGVGDTMRVHDHLKLRIADEVTIAAWVLIDLAKVESLSPLNRDSKHITSKGDRHLRMYCGVREEQEDSFKINFIPRPYVCDLAGDSKLTDNQWHHVAATYDGQRLIIYLDGQVDGARDKVECLWVPNGISEFYIGGISGVEPNLTGCDHCFPGLIDDVRLYDHVLTQQQIKDLLYDPDPALAYDPFPPDDAIDWPKERVPIMWSPGRHVQDVNGHRLYLSTDEWAVRNRTIAPVITTEPNYAATLIAGRTHYWCVDEVNDANGDTWPGYVWKFQTRPYILPPVEDFEGYTDANLSDTWVPSNEYTEVILSKTSEEGYAYEGEQSMVLGYDNTDETYCEATREFDSVQDWTAEDAAALVLYFRGWPSNDPEQMYVALEDATGSDAMVPYDGDANNLQSEEWLQWNIALSDFTDVNMNNISKLFLGFGDREEPMQNPVIGYVMFDELKLYVTRCVPEYGPEANRRRAENREFPACVCKKVKI